MARMNVLGVKLVEGKAKESGNPFEICRLLIGVPIEAGKFGSVQISGYGLEVAEMELDPQAVGSFRDAGLPGELDVQTDTRQFRGKFETFCTGWKPVAKVKAAA